MELGPSWFLGGRQHSTAAMAWRESPTGVREHGRSSKGFSRNLGDPIVPGVEPVPQVEGNRDRREGRLGVREPRST